MINNIDKSMDKSKIKHLVLSGGGPTGFLTYGAIKYLAKENFWCIENIKSIYGCSIGAYLGIVISLGYEWDWLDDYFIKRPWEHLVLLTGKALLNSYEEKGLIGERFFYDAIMPLLGGKNINSSVTLKEFYEFNKIDIHLFSTDINTLQFTKVDLSHTTHPDLLLVNALHMSMAYPFIFKPFIYETSCFIDGGLLNNFPLNDCITQTECNKDEILAFKNIWTIDDNIKNNITKDSTILHLFLTLIKKMQLSIDTELQQEKIKNIVECYVKDFDDINSWFKALETECIRSELIEKGEDYAKIFLQGLL